MVINFSMDFLALYITAKILHIRSKPVKTTVAAVIGALYSLLILTFNIGGILNVFLSIGTAFVLTFAAYGKQKIRNFLKNTVVFYIVNFALGGGVTALCNLLNIWQSKRNIMINGTFDVVYGDLPFGLLLLLAFICGLFSLISGRIAKRKNTQKECALQITVNKNSISLNALVDSGNLLKEPISEKPVIITVFECMRQIIPVELLSLFKTKSTEGLGYCTYNSKIRLIPTSTVGNQGLLFAIFPDSVKIDGKEVDAYVAIDINSSDYSGFSAIVPSILT